MAVIAKVWIEPDCITCNACEDVCPEVFKVEADTSKILAAVRTDGAYDTNAGAKSALTGTLGADLADLIIEAAEDCPVEVIKYELAEGGAETAPAPETEAAAPAPSAPAASLSPSAGVSEALAALMQGDRSLTILFGSQTGNAAGLAERTAKLAAKYGLDATAKDMDEATVDSLSTTRLMVITSTWGEGEMPDNAEVLWKAASAGGPSLAATHFSVCAIGDTSYDEFCKAGHDWNNRLEAMGAVRVHAMAECDVDYVPPWQAWVNEALSRIACVDASGTFHESLVGEMMAYASSGDDEGADSGDFTPGQVLAEEMSITLRLFRYDPVAASSGFDTVACALPGHATLQDLLLAISNDLDGSLAFRRGDGQGTPTTGLRANGRIVLSDVTRLDAIVGDGGTLVLEPLPGHPVVKDLVVDPSRVERSLAAAEPWMRADPREGDVLATGTSMGTMPASVAEDLHRRFDVHAPAAAHGMSDCTPHDPSYLGPGVLTRLWQRASDPRVGADQRRSLLRTLQGEGGVWSETDLSAIRRQGPEGRIVAEAMTDARGRLLSEFRFAGRSGRHIKWFSRTVKWSGTLNETILAAQTMGPIGAIMNLPATVRMATGFTRTGAPLARDLQGFIAPGKMPPLVNSLVDDHHEVKAIFDALDRRF
jgi:succinate dehydrogenase/fumarate reductase-like Fe-S protein/flavodoxin